MEGSIRHKFRTALVGGFNRRDVADYIETTTKNLGNDIAALKKENEELTAAKAECELQLSRMKVQLLDLTAQVKQANEELEAARAELEQLKTAPEPEETEESEEPEAVSDPQEVREPAEEPESEAKPEPVKVAVPVEKASPSGRDILRGISARRKG